MRWQLKHLRSLPTNPGRLSGVWVSNARPRRIAAPIGPSGIVESCGIRSVSAAPIDRGTRSSIRHPGRTASSRNPARSSPPKPGQPRAHRFLVTGRWSMIPRPLSPAHRSPLTAHRCLARRQHRTPHAARASELKQSHRDERIELQRCNPFHRGGSPMNRYWLRIALGALLVFVIGASAMAAVKKGKAEVGQFLAKAGSRLPLRRPGRARRRRPGQERRDHLRARLGHPPPAAPAA